MNMSLFEEFRLFRLALDDDVVWGERLASSEAVGVFSRGGAGSLELVPTPEVLERRLEPLFNDSVLNATELAYQCGRIVVLCSSSGYASLCGPAWETQPPLLVRVHHVKFKVDLLLRVAANGSDADAKFRVANTLHAADTVWEAAVRAYLTVAASLGNNR
jgi:hypothetical protein